MAMGIGNRKIPRVNPNPRPPNEPRVGRSNPVSPVMGVGPSHPVGPAVGAAHPAHGAHKGRVGVGKARPVSGPSAAPGPSSSPSPSPAALAPPIDPRDAQYWKDYAKLEFDHNLQESNLTTEEAFQKAAYEKDKAAREYQEPLETQRLREQANVGGRIYSTATQEDLGNLALQQFGKDSSALEAYQYALAQRAGIRGENKSRYEREAQELLEGATERGAQNEINRPALFDEIFGEGEFSPAAQAMENKANKKSKPKQQAKVGKGHPAGKYETGVGRGHPAQKSPNVGNAQPASKKKGKR